MRILSIAQKQTLLDSVRDNVAKGSNLMTDEWKAYKTVAILADHNHSTVKHSKNQWCSGGGRVEALSSARNDKETASLLGWR